MFDLTKMIRDEANSYVAATQSLTDAEVGEYNAKAAGEADVVFVCIGDETAPGEFRYVAVKGNQVLADITCGMMAQSVKVAAIWATNPEQFQAYAMQTGDESLAAMVAKNAPSVEN